METSDVSVIVITDGKRPIEIVKRALSSVLNQQSKAEKIILVDSSNSTDWKKEIDKYCKERGILHIQTNGNCNGQKKRNVGAKLCDTKYICFLDDDDEWYPEKLERQMEIAKDGYSIVCCYYHINEGKNVKVFEKIPDNPLDILNYNCYGCTSFPLILKKDFDRVNGFDPKFKSNQEWDLWIRLSKLGKIAYVKHPLGIKNNSIHSISHNHRYRMQGWKRLLHKHFKTYINNPIQLKNASITFYKESVRHKSISSICLAAIYYLIAVITITITIRNAT